MKTHPMPRRLHTSSSQARLNLLIGLSNGHVRKLNDGAALELLAKNPGFLSHGRESDYGRISTHNQNISDHLNAYHGTLAIGTTSRAGQSYKQKLQICKWNHLGVHARAARQKTAADINRVKVMNLSALLRTAKAFKPVPAEIRKAVDPRYTNQ